MSRPVMQFHRPTHPAEKVGVLAEFGAINLEGDIEPRKVEVFAQRKSDLQESIAQLQKEVDELKSQHKATPRHIPYKELPEEARFDRLSTQSKHLVDTIKMVAYRAETAMVQIVRQNMTRHDDARSLLRASTAPRLISFRIRWPKPSPSVFTRLPIHLPTWRSGISVTRSTPPKLFFPAPISA